MKTEMQPVVCGPMQPQVMPLKGDYWQHRKDKRRVFVTQVNAGEGMRPMVAYERLCAMSHTAQRLFGREFGMPTARFVKEFEKLDEQDLDGAA